ncbi:MAG: alpha/beta fold hydrolase, partial [Hyphomicrobiales bacterium]
NGERYESLSEAAVKAMWEHPEGLEKHPLYPNFMDYGPEDRQVRFERPTLWMHGNYLARSDGNSGKIVDERIPTGNPFVDQFSRYFPDLRARQIAAGHFFPEESPEVTNETLLAFLAGRI